MGNLNCCLQFKAKNDEENKIYQLNRVKNKENNNENKDNNNKYQVIIMDEFDYLIIVMVKL